MYGSDFSYEYEQRSAAAQSWQPSRRDHGNTVYDQPVQGQLHLDLSHLRNPPQEFYQQPAFDGYNLPSTSSCGSTGVVPWAHSHAHQQQEQYMNVDNSALHPDLYNSSSVEAGTISPFSLDEYDEISALYSTSPGTLSSSADGSALSADVNVFDLTFGSSLSLYDYHTHAPSPQPVSAGTSPVPALIDATGSPSSSEASIDSSAAHLPPYGAGAGYFDAYHYPSKQQELPQARLHAPLPVHIASPSQQPCDKSAVAAVNGEKPTGSHHRRRFPCLFPSCGRKFTSQYTLKVHTDAHRPKPRPSFPCSYGPLSPSTPDAPGVPGGTCTERFSRQHDRLRHEVAKHGKVCEFLCQECGRFFSSRKTLGNHKCPVLAARGGTRWVE